jgi:GntR family transcriptional regulator/MocR family aminotransferase
MIRETVARELADHLEIVPSVAGLHLAAVARSCSADQMKVVARLAAEAGVAVQELSGFGVDAPGPPGLLLGYGAIPTARIEDGLRRLKSCFYH